MQPAESVGKKHWFIKYRFDPVEDHYTFKAGKELLGQGTYGSVIKAKHKHTGQQRALKQIPKSKLKEPDRLKTEIEILKTLDHPNVIRLYEVFDNADAFYLSLELCSGGELFDYIIDHKYFKEDRARTIFLQIIRAIAYCHKRGIAHRDLKPENFLLLSTKNEAGIKMIDFNLSKIYGEGQNMASKKNVMQTRAGTAYYISPEVLKGKYDESCDIWSAGIILYILLCGYPPFYAEEDKDILRAIEKGAYDFNGKEWKTTSAEVKDLIQQILVKADTRINLKGIFEHPWMKKRIIDENLKINFGNLLVYQRCSLLKKIMISYIVSQLNEEDIITEKMLFLTIDVECQGILTYEEVRKNLKNTGNATPEEITKAIRSLDIDDNNSIEYTEFLAGTISKEVYQLDQRISDAFRFFDVAISGRISAKCLKEILGAQSCFDGKDDKFWETLLESGDFNKDGVIDMDDFVKLMKN